MKASTSGRAAVSRLSGLDFVFDDVGVFLVGVPLAVLVALLWAWTPIAAVAFVGVLLASAVGGAAYLLRGTATASWVRALPASITLLLVGTVILAAMTAVEATVFDAGTWPFRWLAGEKG